MLRSSSALQPDHDTLFVVTVRLSSGLLISGGYIKYVRRGTYLFSAVLHCYFCQTHGRVNISVRCAMLKSVQTAGALVHVRASNCAPVNVNGTTSPRLEWLGTEPVFQTGSFQCTAFWRFQAIEQALCTQSTKITSSIANTNSRTSILEEPLETTGLRRNGRCA